MSTTVGEARARLAAHARYRPTEDRTPLERDLAAAKLEQYITKVVAEAPPLTPEQRDRLATILRDSPNERTVRRSSRVDDELREREL